MNARDEHETRLREIKQLVEAQPAPDGLAFRIRYAPAHQRRAPNGDPIAVGEQLVLLLDRGWTTYRIVVSEWLDPALDETHLAATVNSTVARVTDIFDRYLLAREETGK